MRREHSLSPSSPTGSGDGSGFSGGGGGASPARRERENSTGPPDRRDTMKRETSNAAAQWIASNNKGLGGGERIREEDMLVGLATKVASAAAMAAEQATRAVTVANEQVRVASSAATQASAAAAARGQPHG